MSIFKQIGAEFGKFVGFAVLASTVFGGGYYLANDLTNGDKPFSLGCGALAFGIALCAVGIVVTSRRFKQPTVSSVAIDSGRDFQPSAARNSLGERSTENPQPSISPAFSKRTFAWRWIFLLATITQVILLFLLIKTKLEAEKWGPYAPKKTYGIYVSDFTRIGKDLIVEPSYVTKTIVDRMADELFQSGERDVFVRHDKVREGVRDRIEAQERLIELGDGECIIWGVVEERPGSQEMLETNIVFGDPYLDYTAIRKSGVNLGDQIDLDETQDLQVMLEQRLLGRLNCTVFLGIGILKYQRKEYYGAIAMLQRALTTCGEEQAEVNIAYTHLFLALSYGATAKNDLSEYHLSRLILIKNVGKQLDPIVSALKKRNELFQEEQLDSLQKKIGNSFSPDSKGRAAPVSKQFKEAAEMWYMMKENSPNELVVQSINDSLERIIWQTKEKHEYVSTVIPACKCEFWITDSLWIISRNRQDHIFSIIIPTGNQIDGISNIVIYKNSEPEQLRPTTNYRRTFLDWRLKPKLLVVEFSANHAPKGQHVVDKSGKLISFPDSLSFRLRSSNGLLEYKEGNFVGFVNPNNEEVIPGKYQKVRPYSEGLASVCNQGKWGFVDERGKVVIALKYTQTRDFYDGHSFAWIGDQMMIIDKKGGSILINGYTIGSNFWRNRAAVIKSGKYGFVNWNGELIIPCKYDFLLNSFSEDYPRAKVVLNSQPFFIDSMGKCVQEELFPCPTDH